MKRIVSVFIFCLAAFSVIAQEEVYSSSGKPVSDYRKKQREEERRFDKSKLIFGGGVILGVGSGVTNLGLSPIIGYKFTDKFAAGIGLSYQYLQIKNATEYLDSTTGAVKSYTLKTSIYSGSIWARYLVWNNIFVHLEPEINSYEQFTRVNNFVITKDRIFVPCVLVGGGIRQPVSDRVSIVAKLLYDVLQDKNSPYRNRLDVRFGVNVGF